ncbi:hypothetical protein G9A89_017872 [Geosiphon pyriformis]|nr:hypothetical protein G9A89_017872 [Geosiphon pyriformis]
MSLIDACPKCSESIFLCNICRQEKLSSIQKYIWASTNYQPLNEFIKKYNLESLNINSIFMWIPFDEFESVEKIGQGGYGTVYKSTWSPGEFTEWDKETKSWLRKGPQQVALKTLPLENDSNKVFHELNAYYLHDRVNYVNKISPLGITKNSFGYLLVMEYCEHGDLRQYLEKNFTTFLWPEKIRFMRSLCINLWFIHKIDLLHRDLHPGNMLLSYDGPTIVDFGQSCFENLGAVEEGKKNEDICGVLPYIAPEVLRNKPYTKKAGMIMWQITSGQPPFYNVPHDASLVFEIWDGRRPDIIEGTPQCYVKLMTSCWHQDPEKRPTALELRDILEDWNLALNFPDVNFEYPETKEALRQFEESAEVFKKVSETYAPPEKSNSHSLAIYHSHILTLPQEFDEDFFVDPLYQSADQEFSLI